MYLTTRALVLRVTDYNDRDALLTVLTQGHGKLTVKARGLRRRSSPLIAPCQLLAYAEFTLFEYRGQYTVNEGQALELFPGLRRDLTKLALGTYFAQVAEVLSQEDQPNSELLQLVLNCLYALDKLGRPQEQIKAVFELRAACLAGFTPDLTACRICGADTPDRFDITHGRVECVRCAGATEDGIRLPVTPGMLAAMRYIAFCPGRKLFSFQMEQSAMRTLCSVTEGYLCAQLERGFSALDFYKSLDAAQLDAVRGRAQDSSVHDGAL